MADQRETKSNNLFAKKFREECHPFPYVATPEERASFLHEDSVLGIQNNNFRRRYGDRGPMETILGLFTSFEVTFAHTLFLVVQMTNLNDSAVTLIEPRDWFKFMSIFFVHYKLTQRFKCFPEDITNLQPERGLVLQPGETREFFLKVDNLLTQNKIPLRLVKPHFDVYFKKYLTTDREKNENLKISDIILRMRGELLSKENYEKYKDGLVLSDKYRETVYQMPVIIAKDSIKDYEKPREPGVMENFILCMHESNGAVNLFLFRRDLLPSTNM